MGTSSKQPPHCVVHILVVFIISQPATPVIYLGATRLECIHVSITPMENCLFMNRKIFIWKCNDKSQ